jgi:ATP-dependent Clp protease ATP-binding subunit ClpA
MADDVANPVRISRTLATVARRFGIDVSGVVDEVLRERILREPMSMLTARMLAVLLAAQKTAAHFGHKHIGTEHVFLAILLDPHAIPSQMMEEFGAREKMVEQIQRLLASESYNRPHVSEAGGESGA